ncbi:chorismate--pyruvate lyase family protein [Polynucleobacter sphagniphilus]|uniref:chorismate--pyruvate lyase family protein n=1 Tax=Polynucleobacter sphagniphilus TaxID=1743169 RepID=UPI0018EA08F9|nr:chorismate lyase [Polynucleobacter sphagniphilus]
MSEPFTKKLEVLVLNDGRQDLNSDESRYFHFKIKRCRIREVLLCANGEALVMARSIIPTPSLSGSNQSVLRLGTKPLGAVLFAKSRTSTKKKALRKIAFLEKKRLFLEDLPKKVSLPSHTGLVKADPLQAKGASTTGE